MFIWVVRKGIAEGGRGAADNVRQLTIWSRGATRARGQPANLAFWGLCIQYAVPLLGSCASTAPSSPAGKLHPKLISPSPHPCSTASCSRGSSRGSGCRRCRRRSWGGGSKPASGMTPGAPAGPCWGHIHCCHPAALVLPLNTPIHTRTHIRTFAWQGWLAGSCSSSSRHSIEWGPAWQGARRLPFSGDLPCVAADTAVPQGSPTTSSFHTLQSSACAQGGCLGCAGPVPVPCAL